MFTKINPAHPLKKLQNKLKTINNLNPNRKMPNNTNSNSISDLKSFIILIIISREEGWLLLQGNIYNILILFATDRKFPQHSVPNCRNAYLVVGYNELMNSVVFLIIYYGILDELEKNCGEKAQFQGTIFPQRENLEGEISQS